jgi:hypothetical protein
LFWNMLIFIITAKRNINDIFWQLLFL